MLSFFYPNFGENKKGLQQFLNIPVIYHRAKNPNIPMTHSWEKSWKDSLTEVWQFRQSELSLIAEIELFPKSLSIFNPGFSLLCFPFWKRFGKMLKPVLAWNWSLFP